MRTPILSLLILSLLSYSADAGPLRKRLGVSRPAVEVPDKVATEPAGSSPEKVWGIIGDRPGACPTCPRIPVYGWIEQKPVEQPTEKQIDDAASRLAKGGLSREEEKVLAAVIDAPAVAKAIRQEWSLGSCGMACRAHGSNLYDVSEDGVVTLAKEQPAVAPNEGVSGGRMFGRRRW